MKQKKLIIITGPTASGKTAIAIQIAQHFSTEIISADSRQCFKELNIGVARPSTEELSLVKHYFINSHSVHDNINAAYFSAYAGEVLEKIFSKHDVAVMAGGTGLYIRAFVQGLDEIPEVLPHIRNQIKDDYANKGISWLDEQLRINDPLFYDSGEIKNPQRMMRALEVKLSTGLSIKQFHGHNELRQHPFSIETFAIDVDREQLYNNINQRVDKMVEAGLEAEARSLLPLRHLNALQTVGYSELFEYFDGNYTISQAIEKIKQNTRRYAKRQLTWFRKDASINWVKDSSDILKKIAPNG